MTYFVESLLDDLDTESLYGILGDAWRAQFMPVKGESCGPESSPKIGKREFEALLPFLQVGLQPVDRLDVIGNVRQVIKDNNFWNMPAYVVAALAARTELFVPLVTSRRGSAVLLA